MIQSIKKASTPDERIRINEKLTEIDTWLWDDGINADVKVMIPLILFRMSNFILCLDIEI